jgi:DNA polymerase I-like protein with 3'-5' exonuclease and polymerase domains
MSGRILYMTDKFRISPGYRPAFDRMIAKCGIKSSQVIPADIYNLVDKPLTKTGNESTWKFNPEKLDEIKAAFTQRVRALRPSLIVVSCPAVLGVLANGDRRAATLEKMRGGVYEFEGIKTIVVYPITAIHQRVDSRIVTNEDGESDTQQPYKVKDGAQILAWDWQKVGRFFHGKQRVLPPFRYSICRTITDCFAARDFLKDCRLIALDIETGLYPPTITCVGFTGLHSSGAVHSFVIPLYDEFAESGCFWESADDHAIAWSVIRDINALPILKTLQNGPYDAAYFMRDQLGLTHYLLDSQILWWSLYMEMPKRLDFISSVLLDNYQYWKDDIKGDDQEKIQAGTATMEGYWRYNALDCYNTLFNTLYLVMLLKKNRAMQFNYRDAFLRSMSGFRMSMRGLRVDESKRAYHRKTLMEEMDKQTELLRFMLDDPEFNINSTADKCWLLYDIFGLRERTARGRFVDQSKPKKGKNAPSAGKIPIKMAKSEHPLFNYTLNTLEAALEPRVQLSNIFGYPDPDKPSGVRGGYYMPRGRLRTTLGGVHTETTRFNSKESAFWEGGNLQNIRGKYKDFIIPDEDCIFLDVDYSQSDDVFIAYESQDPDKMKVIEDDLDSHSYNGELFFGIPYDKIVAGKKAGEDWCVHPIIGVRQNSKRASHGSNFQMAAFTLYITMGREAVVACANVLGHADAGSWSQERLVNLCGVLMGRYRKRYKRLTEKEWYAEIAKELMTTGKVTNCFGVTRQFLGDPKDNATQREATAYYGQSATAGNMNRVMYEIDWGYIQPDFRDGPNPDRHAKPLKMDWESHGFSFMLQVHDNFLSQINLKHPRWKEACHNLLQVMNRPIIIHGREVRVKAEAELGIRWGKGMLPWNGDVDQLDSIVAKLKHG